LIYNIYCLYYVIKAKTRKHKKILAFAFFLGLAVSSFAQTSNGGTIFQTIKMEEAKSQAAKEDKLIFVDIYTTWCGPCKTMSEKIFPQKEVGDYFNSNFINVKFDAERGEGIQVAKNYNVTAYPTFLILDKEGKEVGRVVGAKTPAEVFIKDVEKVREIKK